MPIREADFSIVPYLTIPCPVRCGETPIISLSFSYFAIMNLKSVT